MLNILIPTMDQVAQLTTDLSLWRLDRCSAEEIYALVDKNRIHLKYLVWVDGMKSKEGEEEFIVRSLESERIGKEYHRAMIYKGQFAGCGGIHRINMDVGLFEIGYWLGEEFQGKGIVSALTKYMTDFGFSVLKANVAEIRCAESNQRSAAVATRLGFKQVESIPNRETVGGRQETQLVFQLARSSK